MKPTNNTYDNESNELPVIDTMSSTTVPLAVRPVPTGAQKTKHRKTTIVVLAVCIVVLLGLVAVYFLYFQPKKSTVSTVVPAPSKSESTQTPTTLVDRTLMNEIKSDQSASDAQVTSETDGVEQVNTDAENVSGSYDENTY